MTTREQLHVCGALTDYSEEEIEKMIAAAREHMPGCSEPEVFSIVLAAMRKDHANRSREQHRRSVGQPVLRVLQGGLTRHGPTDREAEWAALATLVDAAVKEETPSE